MTAVTRSPNSFGGLLACLLATTLLLAVGVNGKFDYDVCESPGGVLLDLDVVGCDESPCLLVKGKNATIKVSFKSNASVDLGNVLVHAIIEGSTFPYDLSDPSICNFVKPSCPIKPQVTYNYTYNMAISESAPEVDLTLKWELINDNKVAITCVKIPMEVVSE